VAKYAPMSDTRFIRDFPIAVFMWVLRRSKQIKHHSTEGDSMQHEKRSITLVTLNNM